MTEKIRPALTPDEWAHPSNNQQLGWACSEVFVGHVDRLESLADRIAALLPPE